MWEEMLSVLIERFSGDTLLASQEDLTKISRLVDTWKDTAIKVPGTVKGSGVQATVKGSGVQATVNQPPSGVQYKLQ